MKTCVGSRRLLIVSTAKDSSSSAGGGAATSPAGSAPGGLRGAVSDVDIWDTLCLCH